MMLYYNLFFQLQVFTRNLVIWFVWVFVSFKENRGMKLIGYNLKHVHTTRLGNHTWY